MSGFRNEAERPDVVRGRRDLCGVIKISYISTMMMVTGQRTSNSTPKSNEFILCIFYLNKPDFKKEDNKGIISGFKLMV